MVTPVDSMIKDWLLDAEKILRRRLRSLPELACSDDPEEAKDALEEAIEIARWLPPDEELSLEERLRTITNDAGLTDKQRVEAVRQVVAPVVKQRGRPRAADALWLGNQALLLRNAAGLSWREIAMELGGCPHTRPRPAISCSSCGERVRKNAERLQWVLGLAGYDVRKLGELRGPHSKEAIRQYITMMTPAEPQTQDKNP